MIDPNPYPSEGVMPLYCTSLIPGTRDRRWEAFEGCTFDQEAGDRVVKFFTGLKHTQGLLAGEEFKLTPDQNWLIMETFGWKRPDGTRKFRICFLEMGRGNGKSQMGAGIAGYLLLADNELNPEIVGVAATRPMARKYCFERLKSMIKVNPSLSQLVDVYRYEIRRRESSQWGGVYEATSSDAASAWGGAPHGIIFDEVHAQPNRELWDALETAMGKRRQPMMWGFTTAGWDRTSLCWELHERTRELANGTISDIEFFGIVYAAAEEDDWTDPAVWRRANPMMGVAFTEDYLEAKKDKAVSTPAFQNTFRTMYLSQWVGSETAFLDMATWDLNDQRKLPPPGKRVAFGGLDLSSTLDLSAFSIVTRNGDKVEFHVKMYAPEEGIVEKERRDRLPYREWVRNGWLTLTPGPTVDQDIIKRDIFQAHVDWDLRDISVDRWNASKLIRELGDEGVVIAEMGQGYASMSAPSKALLKLVAEKNILTGGNGALRAQASFTSATTDAAGNIKPDKSKSSARIDGIVASIMALDGLHRRGQPKKKSAYEDENDVPTVEVYEDGYAEVEEEEDSPPVFRRSAYELDDDDNEE